MSIFKKQEEFANPYFRKNKISKKDKPKFQREYIVTFNYGTPYADNYAKITSRNQEQAYYDAVAQFGRANVARVRVANEDSEKVVRLYGKSQII